MKTIADIKKWIKAKEHPAARFLYDAAKYLKGFSFPVIPWFHDGLYKLSRIIKNLFFDIIRVLWTTPLFQSQLARPAPKLYIYGGMPLVLGHLVMDFGEDVRLSGQTTISGRSSGDETPRLVVGSNVDIGWQTTLAVGHAIKIGDNVRLAGRNFLAGYPGHPLDPEARAAGLPETEDQVGDIVLEDGVWLGTGAMVMAGVTIGAGTVVAAGSIVTKDLPPRVLAGGCPARVIKQIDTPSATANEQTVEEPQSEATEDKPALTKKVARKAPVRKPRAASAAAAKTTTTKQPSARPATKRTTATTRKAAPKTVADDTQKTNGAPHDQA
ncbi:acyltransferase [Rhodobacteraceae bacterium RKSG542]|uniref:acyltransferase n=1 Tax=Pseudovibrio flavus TaxID=2529854 RepID=UPI0012BB6E98|nr:acyltransferase [Pseudovibrio flavus]MTI18899.1 acyltransferase [Pseudovibrio flavus]